jgi:regulator of RNase E activity RraB
MVMTQEQRNLLKKLAETIDLIDEQMQLDPVFTEQMNQRYEVWSMSFEDMAAEFKGLAEE